MAALLSNQSCNTGNATENTSIAVYVPNDGASGEIVIGINQIVRVSVLGTTAPVYMRIGPSGTATATPVADNISANTTCDILLDNTGGHEIWEMGPVNTSLAFFSPNAASVVVVTILSRK